MPESVIEVKCPRCNGTGAEELKQADGTSIWTWCIACEGTGEKKYE